MIRRSSHEVWSENLLVALWIIVKFLNIRTPEKICCSPPKIRTKWLYHRVMHPKDADGIANSVDPDQTAPLGASCRQRRLLRLCRCGGWSESVLYACHFVCFSVPHFQITRRVHNINTGVSLDDFFNGQFENCWWWNCLYFDIDWYLQFNSPGDHIVIVWGGLLRQREKSSKDKIDKNDKKISPPVRPLLQAQQALALPQ